MQIDNSHQIKTYHFAKTNSHQMQIDISRVSFRQN